MTATDSHDPMSDATVDEHGRDLGPVIDDSGEDEQRTSFQLPAYDSRDRRSLHPLIARVGMDASSVFGFMSPNVALAKRLGAMRNFLTRSLVDDDGISIHEKPRAVVRRDDGEQGDQTEWVEVAEVTPRPKAADVRWVVGDNTDWADEDEALEHAWAHGSSLRRFAALMDSETMRVKLSALQNAISHIVSEDGGAGGGTRPTQRSNRSSGSRKTPARSGRS